MSNSLFPNDLRAEYDIHVLDVRQRTAKATQMRNAFVAAKLWHAPAKILDVGCGSGLILAALDAPHAQKVGCDIRTELFFKAGVNRTPVAFVQADATFLPFPHNQFDLVICLAVIEEFPDWCAALQAMAECVAPGGILYITMTNGILLISLYRWLDRLGVRVPDGAWRYAQLSVRFKIDEAKNGFGVKALHGWRYVDVTPSLVQSRLPIVRILPGAWFSWFLKYTVPAFGHAWQKPML